MKKLDLKNLDKCFFDKDLWKYCSIAKWYERNF